MALEKRVEYQYEVKADGQIQVRRDEQIWENGVFLSHTYHRRVFIPGEPIEGDQRLKDIARVVHTPKVVTDYWEAERKRQVDTQR